MLIGTFFLILGLFAWPTNCFDSWVDPNAWDLYSHNDAKPDSCPVCEMSNNKEDLIAAMYYKTVVAQLFSRSSFKKNPHTGNLDRILHISLTNAQMKAVESWTDLRDLNAIVSLALARSKEMEVLHNENESESDFFNFSSPLFMIIGCLGQLLKFIARICSHSSEARFMMFASGVILALFSVHKRYNKNLILLLIGSLIVFGYFFTYIECNRNLEAESLIQYARDSEPDEPNIITKFFGNFFKTSKKEEKIQKLKNAAKLKLPFCRPDEVLIMYLNELFFNQLQVVVEKITDSMNIILKKVPFPFNYLGMIALPFLFWTLLPLMFHYFLNPTTWFNILKGSSSQQNGGPQSDNNSSQEGDRLSGDNLQNFLAAIKHLSKNDEKPNHSAVQNVKDLPEAIAPKLNESSDEPVSEEEINLDKKQGKQEPCDDDKLNKSNNNNENSNESSSWSLFGRFFKS